MSSLFSKIKIFHPSLTTEDFDENIILYSSGGVESIEEWNHPTLAQPTAEQLEAVDGSVLEANAVIRNARIKEYGTLAEQLEYIVENGIGAFIAKQKAVKTNNPYQEES